MFFRLCCFLIASTLLLVGCQQKDNENTSSLEKEQQQFEQVKNSHPTKKNHLNNEQIAVHLSNLAGSVPGVNNASAIIAGPYAVVGIDVDKDLDRTRVGTIKYTVSEALRHDPYGKTAVVIADGDILERLRSMKESMQAGYPISGIIEELSAIVGRYMPDFPIKEDQYNKPDQNKEIISEEEEDKLNIIEEDHSNEQ